MADPKVKQIINPKARCATLALSETNARPSLVDVPLHEKRVLMI